MRLELALAALLPLTVASSNMWAGQSGDVHRQDDERVKFCNVSAENGANAELRPFTVGTETLDPKGGHVQGIAASEDSLYVAQMTRLVKVDWKGNVLAQRAVQSHTGDIAWHDGELYTAVAVFPDCKEGRIQVFDKDLNILGTASANCNQGFDILPAPMRGDGRMFVRAKTKTGESGVSCSFDLIDIGKWCRH